MTILSRPSSLSAAAYAGLEVLLLPATPVALTAGPLFGLGPGTALSALGGLTGACTCFLLGRTVARRRVLVWTEGSTVFRAIDRAIAKDGFRVVLLARARRAMAPPVVYPRRSSASCRHPPGVARARVRAPPVHPRAR